MPLEAEELGKTLACCSLSLKLAFTMIHTIRECIDRNFSTAVFPGISGRLHISTSSATPKIQTPIGGQCFRSAIWCTGKVALFALCVTAHCVQRRFCRQISWAERQLAKIRKKRDFLPLEISEVDSSDHSFSHLPVVHQDLMEVGAPLLKPKQVKLTAPGDTTVFNDPMWSHQWYLVSTGQSSWSLLNSPYSGSFSRTNRTAEFVSNLNKLFCGKNIKIFHLCCRFKGDMDDPKVSGCFRPNPARKL